jgi:hypothetical protein
MACNVCETQFQGYRSVVVSIEKSGSNARLYVENRSRNIIMVRRILLAYSTKSGGGGMLFLRPKPELGLNFDPSGFVEAGSSSLFYTATMTGVAMWQAQAEYIEFDGRSLSCSLDM